MFIIQMAITSAHDVVLEVGFNLVVLNARVIVEQKLNAITQWV